MQIDEAAAGSWEASGIELAYGLRMGRCDHCDGLHVMLLDEGGDPFAQAVLDDDDAREVWEMLGKLLAEAGSVKAPAMKDRQ
jgi:hypothetical protein